MPSARCICFVLALLASCVLVPARPATAAGKSVPVFAAASTTNAISEISAVYKEKGLGEITASFASSSTLAKQIEQGAPAAVFLSANSKWMDYLDEKKMVDASSRKDLLRNRIALVVPVHSKAANIDIRQGADLVSLLGADGKLAVGDPEHVPVGMYGKKALENLGLWDSIKDRLAPAKDVRAGLALVERGEVPLGLVYSSDVAASSKVRIIGIFPAGSHPEIVYPVAAIAGQNVDAAKAFINFLSGPEAMAIFKKYGFEGR